MVNDNEIIEFEKEDEVKDELSIKRLVDMGQNLWFMVNENEVMKLVKEDFDLFLKIIDIKMSLFVKYEVEVE